MAMEAPKLPQQLQSLGTTAPLHDLPSPSRRRLRGKSESPEKKGSAARGISDRRNAFYDEAETTLEEARNQCSELQDRIARFQEQMQAERTSWRKRLEEKARMRMRPQEDEDDDEIEELRAEPEGVPTEQSEDAGEEQGQSRELSGEGELTLRIPAEAAPIPFSEAEPQPDESEPILQQRKSRKQRHQSSETDNQSEPRSRRRARRHSEPAVQTRRQSLEVPGLAAEDDLISPSGEAFVKSLGRRFQQPLTPSVSRKQQLEMRRRHSAPPTPEPTADLDAELSAPEPRKGMLTKLINFFTPQWMRDDVVYDYAHIRRSQSRRRNERRSGHQAPSVQERARASHRVAVYASQR